MKTGNSGHNKPITNISSAQNGNAYIHHNREALTTLKVITEKADAVRGDT